MRVREFSSYLLYFWVSCLAFRASLFLRPTRPRPPDFDLIVSYVTVTASKGRAPRLSAKNFQIFEDNKEQKIDYFAVQDQPATVGILWGGRHRPRDPDVRECPRDFHEEHGPGFRVLRAVRDTVTTPFTTDIELMPAVYALSGATRTRLSLDSMCSRNRRIPARCFLLSQIRWVEVAVSLTRITWNARPSAGLPDPRHGLRLPVRRIPSIDEGQIFLGNFPT